MDANITNPSFSNPNYTFHYDKYSCIREFYFIHVTFCYLVFISGLFCLITRLIPKLGYLHVWFGRAYILSMLWATATSLLIHNTGLPLAVLLSFVWVLLGLSVGWIAIKVHELEMNKLANTSLKNVILKTGIDQDADLGRLLIQQKIQIAGAKTFRARVFSYKALHGLVMFVSWFNIVGRIFASDQSGNFTCHTYPVYKPIDSKTEGNYSGKPLTFVPERNPKYDKLPWAYFEGPWMAILFFAPAIIFGIVGGTIAYRNSSKAAQKQEKVDVTAAAFGTQ